MLVIRWLWITSNDTEVCHGIIVTCSHSISLGIMVAFMRTLLLRANLHDNASSTAIMSFSGYYSLVLTKAQTGATGGFKGVMRFSTAVVREHDGLMHSDLRNTVWLTKEKSWSKAVTRFCMVSALSLPSLLFPSKFDRSESIHVYLKRHLSMHAHTHRPL